MRSPILLVPSLASALALFVACSGNDDESGETKKNTPTHDAGDGFLFGSAGMGGAGQADSAIGPNGCRVGADSTGCVGETLRGETIPLDIYVMFDQSGSMLNVEEGGVTRIDAVRSAVGDFLKDPKSAGLGVGIGYFGQQPIGQTTCDPATFEAASVPVGLLPGNASAIIDSLAKREPTGETPSGAAIVGACTYGKQWKRANPSHEVVILLVTDGEPKAPVTCGTTGTGPCCPTLEEAVSAASDCRTGSPGLKTYVLGVGPFLDNLGKISAAGGTDHAYLVAGGDVSKQVVAALNAIRISAQIPCELVLPPAPDRQTLDYDLVNIVYTTDSCQTTTLQYRETESACDATGGWYYDDPSNPQKVHLCGKSCDDVSIPGGQLLFSVGCHRPPPR